MKTLKDKKVIKTIKEEVWIANIDIVEKKFKCAKGQILPGSWQSNSTLRKWLRDKYGEDCIKRTNKMIPLEDVVSKNTISELREENKALEDLIKDLGKRVQSLESNKEEKEVIQPKKRVRRVA